jgi:hypothetical protein
MGRVQAVDCPGTKRFLITVKQADGNLTITKYRYSHLPYTSSGLTCDSALMCRPVHYIRNFLVHIAENGQQRFEPLLGSELKATQLDYLQASLYSYSLRIRLLIYHTTTIWFLPANPPHVNQVAYNSAALFTTTGKSLVISSISNISITLLISTSIIIWLYSISIYITALRIRSRSIYKIITENMSVFLHSIIHTTLLSHLFTSSDYSILARWFVRLS